MFKCAGMRSHCGIGQLVLRCSAPKKKRVRAPSLHNLGSFTHC